LLMSGACLRVIRSPIHAVLLFFFFSSRRRHTRFSRDWSSDVCSSDLSISDTPPPCPVCTHSSRYFMHAGQRDYWRCERCKATFRSEERRVGKECRARWWRQDSQRRIKNNQGHQNTVPCVKQMHRIEGK